MIKKKGIRILVTLECKNCRLDIIKQSPGVSRYLTKKNRRNNPERLTLKKYCSYCNQTTIHKEVK